METDKKSTQEGRRISGLELARKAASILADRHGINIMLLDVRGISGVTDYELIVSGNSAPHLKAMVTETEKQLKSDGLYCYSKAGDPDSGWIVLDYVDVVIHIFSESKRAYYSIEDLWDQALRVRLDLPVQPDHSPM